MYLTCIYKAPKRVKLFFQEGDRSCESEMFLVVSPNKIGAVFLLKNHKIQLETCDPSRGS